MLLALIMYAAGVVAGVFASVGFAAFYMGLGDMPYNKAIAVPAVVVGAAGMLGVVIPPLCLWFYSLI